MLAVQADGHEVQTVEGLGTASELDPVQEGFKEEHGLQCGFCTPGMMMASRALLNANPDPTEDEVRFALSGNLCRCTGYQNIVKAVLWAAAKRARRRAGGRAPPTPPPRPHATLPSTPPRGPEMTVTESRALDEIKIGGMGASRLRVEDNRFIRGRGNYIDDVVLPGMLHMEILRSPLAHARITSIDTSKAYADPRRTAGAHRRDDGDPQPRLDADAQLRHPGRAGHRQGALPGPGGRLRHRRRPLHRQGRLRGDPGRVRAAAADRQPDPGAWPTARR